MKKVLVLMILLLGIPNSIKAEKRSVHYDFDENACYFILREAHISHEHADAYVEVLAMAIHQSKYGYGHWHTKAEKEA